MLVRAGGVLVKFVSPVPAKAKLKKLGALSTRGAAWKDVGTSAVSLNRIQALTRNQAKTPSFDQEPSKDCRAGCLSPVRFG